MKIGGALLVLTTLQVFVSSLTTEAGVESTTVPATEPSIDTFTTTATDGSRTPDAESNATIEETSTLPSSIETTLSPVPSTTPPDSESNYSSINLTSSTTPVVDNKNFSVSIPLHELSNHSVTTTETPQCCETNESIIEGNRTTVLSEYGVTSSLSLPSGQAVNDDHNSSAESSSSSQTQKPTVSEQALSSQSAPTLSLNSTTAQPTVWRQVSVENQTSAVAASTTTTTTKPSTEAPFRACECLDEECKCCTGMLMHTLGFPVRNRGCVALGYSADDFRFTMALMFNDFVLYRNSFSGKNPRPVCVPVPRLPRFRLCARFNNVYFLGRNLHACTALEVQRSGYQLFAWPLGCVRVGANGFAVVTPEDGGGLPQGGGPDPDDDADAEDYEDPEDSEEDDISDYIGEEY